MASLAPFAVVLLTFAAVLLVPCSFPLISAAPVEPSPAPSVSVSPGRFIVVGNSGVSNLDTFINTLLHTLPLGISITVQHKYTQAFTGFSFSVDVGIANTVVNLLKLNPLISFILPDQLTSIATQPSYGFPQPYSYPDTPVHESVNLTANENVPTGVERILSANSSFASATPPALDIAVAVIDTGIDFGHPDLPSAVEGINCVSSPWRNPTTSSVDDNGHGTHVSGILGAANNNGGIVGTAPGVRLFSVKVADQYGQALISDIVCGFEWVIQHNSQVPSYYGDPSNPASNYIQLATISIGAPGVDDGACGSINQDALHLAICATVNSGVSVVTSAGNSALPITTFVPAAYSEVLTVTAFTDTDGLPGSLGPLEPTCAIELDDSRATYSNYALTTAQAAHTVAAPGSCINSTYLRSKGEGSYAVMSGTSMAAPHVTGVLALCYSRGLCKINAAKNNLANFVADQTAFNQQNPGYGAVLDPLGKIYGPLVTAELY